MTVGPIDPSALYHACNLDGLGFENTSQLEELTEYIGQNRALKAVGFGIGIQKKGYNLFALGPSGLGKKSLVMRYMESQARSEPVPSDWCYVNNFKDTGKPYALKLPSGNGLELADDMQRLVDELHRIIPAVFETEEYITRSLSIEDELSEKEDKALSDLREKAKERQIALLRTPTGFTLAPIRDGEPVGIKEFRKLPEEERKRIESDVSELQDLLSKALHKLPQWQKQVHEKVNELNREMVASAIASLIAALQQKYSTQDAVCRYLNEVQQDIIRHFQNFLSEERNKVSLFGKEIQQPEQEAPWVRRYQVNVLVSQDRDGGAPVIFEDLPSYNTLIGRVEHHARLGALETDFSMIRPGALHKANGGYLILDAAKILMQPYAWEGLKRALRSDQIRIESLGQLTSLISTISLEPEPIPLKVKVVLLGDRYLYYLLSGLDPEFAELFKVEVDFDDRMERNEENKTLYARLIASIIRREGIRHFDRTAVSRVIEYSARLAGDSERLSTHMRSIYDLLQESDYWAGLQQHDTVTSQDVQQAIDADIERSSRIRERTQEEIGRGTILIDTEGEKVGQINGLSVLTLGNYGFGKPSRITARVRMGKGQVIDIEREVELGGPIHSKGVLILSGFIAGRYALDLPLSLSASLVFEQSYSGVEGDSASSAELYTLLSALSEAPIKQSLAVTGSVNQHGEVQPIGGVNEKIEGFFDVCKARGFTGDQGVLIPASNVKHLMLRRDIVEAAQAGRFAVYPITTIDEGIELLTGIPAGKRDDKGRFPENSINGLVENKLIRFSEKLAEFGKKAEIKDKNAS